MPDELILGVGTGAGQAAAGDHTHSGAYAPMSSGYRPIAYLSHPGPIGTLIPAEGIVHLLPLLVPRSLTVDRILAEPTVVGTAGAVVRLGIYAADSDGLPGALILDAGTIDGTVAAVQAITISQALTAGFVFLASVVQGAAGVRPTMRTRAGGSHYTVAHDNQNAVTFTLAGYSRSAGLVAGALPATAGSAVGSVHCPSMAVRLV